MGKCKKCGVINTSDARFCRNCGTSFDKEQKSMRWISYILIPVLCLAIGLGIGYAITEGSSNSHYDDAESTDDIDTTAVVEDIEVDSAAAVVDSIAEPAYYQ